RYRWVVLVLATVSIWACSLDAGSNAWTGTVDTLATGTVVVMNPPSPTPFDRQWTVEEIDRIGELEGDSPYMLGRIQAIAVDAAGRLLVFDGLANELRVFSQDGRHVETHGREGAGPGEFGSV